MPETPVTAEDIAEVTRQLGRPARDILAIASRCVCGRPLVVKTKPRLENGTPFPTLYYLTQPAATAAVSTLEASGYMAELQELLTQDQAVAQLYLAAHQSYLAEREGIEVVEELTDFSAGGMPTRVKCLHALVGHSLAKGPGVNPIGDLALAALTWSPKVCKCV
jgi:hypothetical protein